MSERNREPFSRRLFRVKERLRKERPQASALELDRIKLRAIRQASSGQESRPAAGRSSGFMRSRRIISATLAICLLGGGTAVFAATGGFKAASSKSSAANSQYCPPKSQQPGQPKKPGPAKCGKSKTKVRLRVSDRTPRKRQLVRFSGTVSPARDGRLVYIQKRLSSGKWRTIAKMKLKDAGSKRSRFSRKLKVLGNSTYRARVRSDSTHTRGTSRRKSLRIH